MHPLARRALLAVCLVLVVAAFWRVLPGRKEIDQPQAEVASAVATPPPAAAPVAPAATPRPAIAPAREAAEVATAIARSPAATPAFERFNSWAAGFLTAPQQARSAQIAQGVRAAAERRSAMAQLIVDDPRQALQNAVPMVVRQQLPPEVVALLEERVNARGFYGVLGVIGGAADQRPIRREARIGQDRKYDAHVFGRRISQPTTENASLNGIAIGAALALDDRPLRVLERGEIPDATKPVVETCPVSGKSTEVARANDDALPPIDDTTPAVEIDGTIHYLCDGGHIVAIEEQLVAGEGVTGGPVKPTTTITSTQSTGVRTLLYMRVAFPESNREPQTETAAYEMMRQVNDWFVENSFGNIYLLTTVTPLLVLPRSEAWYNGGGGDEYDVRADAQALARSLGYDTSQYDLDIVAYTGGPGSFGGLGYVGGKGTWLKSITVGVAVHELGHNFGLWHANFWDTSGTSVIGSGSNGEYGNSFDTMGSASAGNLHFNANHKAKINWLPEQTFVHRATASGTYRIFAFDQPRLDPANRYAIKVVKDSDRDYWLEFRQKYGASNLWLRDGVSLNWSPWVNSNGGAQLLDTTPGSPDGKTDSALVIGRTFSDAEAGIHLTPIGKGGTAPESIDVVVNVGAFAANQPPAMSVNASATSVGTGVTVNFTANAADPDGDALSYAWDFGDKTFSNTNTATVSKSWGTAGDYVVRCEVSDMKGRTASDSIAVRVGSPATYRVSGLVTLGGQPMAGVRIHNGLTGSSYRGVFTDTDGSYTLAGVSGSVTVSAARHGFSFAASGFTNPLSVTADVNGANFTATETPGVTLIASDADAAEGAANTGKFTLTRTGATASALTVNLYNASGTATKGSDYSLSPDLTSASPYYTLTIPAGQASLDVTLTATDDTGSEGPETARLELVPGSGYIIGGAQSAAVTIQDGDSALPRVTLAVADIDGAETGDPASLVAVRAGSTTSALTVRFAVSGSATSGSDFTSIGTQVVIPAGASSAPISIAPLNDTAVEGNETVTITISTDAAYIRAASSADYTGTINILDDDIPTVTVAATDSAAAEAGGDTGTFVVTRTGSTAQPLTVNYALTGSAHHGVDYVPLPGVLTIPAGSSVGSVTVTPIDDGLGEPQQTVVFQIRSAPAYVVGASSNATVNIADNSDVPVVLFGVVDGTAAEPSDTGAFRFTTTGTGSGNITVRYTVTGTATAGTDYTELSGSLSIGRNTTATVTVTPLDDSELEGYETVTVTIDADAAYTTHLDAAATIRLRDDDQPVVNVSTTNDSFTESGGTAKFWISRTGSTTNALDVNYAMGGTATHGEDYTVLTGTITIPAAAAGVMLNVAPTNDSLVEGTETIVVTLAAGSYGVGLGSATHYLADSETPSVQVRFTSSTGSGNEDAGTVNLSVELSAAAAAPVTVEYVINGGTATAGVDYALTAGVLTFETGETAKTIPLAIIDDAYDEPNQTVLIKLQNANGAALGTSTHTFTINDNDAPPVPTVAFAASTANGAESVSPAAIVVSLSAEQAAPVTVDFAVTGGTAASGSDFTLDAGTLTFAAGETAKILPGSVVNDASLESNETIIVALSNPAGATLGAITTHTYTINDDDAATLSIIATDATASEAADGGLFTLTRTGSSANAIDVNITITGSATAGTDYTPLQVPVSFASGATTATVSVSPLDDSAGEASETVIATIAAGTGYTIGTPSSATVTIVDDEPQVSITATDAAAAELNSDPGTFTITRTGSTAADLTVNVTISGSAASPADYAPLATPVVIPAGSATATRTVTPVNDTATEGSETVIATLAGGGYSVSGTGTATVTITDDDINNPPSVTLTSPAATQVGVPAGVGLVLEATASDDGKPVTPGVLTTLWSKVSGPGTVTFGNAAQPSTTATFSTNGRYVLRLTANDGELQTSVDLTVEAGAASTWTTQNIGSPTPAGSFSETDGTFTVRGGGSNISGTSDQFHFVYQTLNGDGDIRARLVSMTGGNSSAKAGVMLRNTSAANSRAAFMSLYGSANTNDDSSWRYRATDGASFSTTSSDGAVPPYWIRVVRAGQSVSGYQSSNGQTWTQIGSTQTVTMNASTLIGLAVTSNNTSQLCTAVFDNVLISAWPANTGAEVNAGADVAITLPSPAALTGTATDDGRPLPATLTTAWSKLSGPGAVTFADASLLETNATFSAAGSYALRLIADDGQVKTFDDVTVTTAAPVVSVQASASVAAEFGLASGSFTFSRTGGTSAALIVRFAAGGSATNGSDFADIGTAVTIPIGQTEALVMVTPLSDAASEGVESVTLTILADPSYAIGGTAGSATVTISDLPADAWRQQKFGANANDPAIAGDMTDIDGDGLANLLEYALAAEPLLFTTEGPAMGIEGSDLTLTYRRPSSAPDVAYDVEQFTTTGTWAAATFTEQTLSDNGTIRTVKARVPIAGATEKLIRLRVTRVGWP